MSLAGDSYGSCVGCGRGSRGRPGACIERRPEGEPCRKQEETGYPEPSRLLLAFLAFSLPSILPASPPCPLFLKCHTVLVLKINKTHTSVKWPVEDPWAATAPVFNILSLI